jgi:hypothetical protein
MSAEANLAVGAAILLAGLSLLLAIVGFTSYARLRNARLLWVSFAFVGFLVQGAALAWRSYEARGDIASGGTDLLLFSLLNLGIVLALYFAVLKR